MKVILRPKGYLLLSITVLMIVSSGFLLHWYQNEIQFRLQASAVLRHQTIYQSLNGVSARSALYFQNYTETELQEKSLTIPRSELGPFFDEWSVTSHRSKNQSSFFNADFTYQPSHTSVEPLVFQALYRFEKGTMTDSPWLNLNSQAPRTLPETITWQSPQDHQRSQEAPFFILKQEPISSEFDYVFLGDVQLVWQGGKLIVSQGNTTVFDIDKHPLFLQIQGNASLRGDLGSSMKELIFIEIAGNLSLELIGNHKTFSPYKPQLFIHVGQQVSMKAESEMPVRVNGYFRIDQGCLNLKTAIRAIYWRGSLACSLEFPQTFSIPLHLLHTPHSPSNIPLVFGYTALRPNGIKLKES